MPSGIGTKGSKRAGEERRSTPAEKKKEKKKKDNYESAKNCKQEKTPVEQATATATETKTGDLERGRSDPKLAREHQLGPSLVMGEACDFERCKHVLPTYLQIKTQKQLPENLGCILQHVNYCIGNPRQFWVVRR